MSLLSTSYKSITPSPSESNVLLKKGISKTTLFTVSFSSMTFMLLGSPFISESESHLPK